MLTCILVSLSLQLVKVVLCAYISASAIPTTSGVSQPLRCADESALCTELAPSYSLGELSAISLALNVQPH